MSGTPVTIPARCDAELLADLFELPSDLRAIALDEFTPPPTGACLPSGPIKLLTGEAPVTVRLLSGRGFRKLDHCSCDLDELLCIENDADLRALYRYHHARGTLFARVLRRIKRDRTRGNLATAARVQLPAKGNQLQASLDSGKGRHDQSVLFPLGHAPDAHIAVQNINGRKPTFWNQAKHLIFSLFALAKNRSAAKDACVGEAGQ